MEQSKLEVYSGDHLHVKLWQIDKPKTLPTRKEFNRQPYTLARVQLDKMLRQGCPTTAQVAAVLAHVPAIHKRAMRNGQWFQNLCLSISVRRDPFGTNRAMRELTDRR